MRIHIGRPVTALTVWLSIVATAFATESQKQLSAGTASITTRDRVFDGDGPSRGDGGGETCAEATVIGSLPYSGMGSTCGAVDDYDEVCPYPGSISPDVVYAYTPSSNQTVDLTLCGNSDYDTKLYVYQGSCPDSLIACNEDACKTPSFPWFPYVSDLSSVDLTADNTYYIIVDGYDGNCGNYTLDVDYAGGCVDCPDGATDENEADCGLPNDSVNGGCNSTPPVFSPISCEETICGTAARDGITRDTDWYEVVFTATTDVTWTVEVEFQVEMGIVDNGGIDECPVAFFLESATAEPCEQVSVSATLWPGTWWFFVAPDFDGPSISCGSGYVATLTCDGGGQECPSGPVEWLDPPDGVVDAGRPHAVNGTTPQGIDTILVSAPEEAAESCWELCEMDDGGLGPNGIAGVVDDGLGTYTITLERPITPGSLTTISYAGTDTGTFIAHPANVNGDLAASPVDILELIDFLNDVSTLPWGEYSCDADRSGECNPADILTVIDLLNGAGEFDVWNETSRPETDGSCP